jgi:hypothetical protein
MSGIKTRKWIVTKMFEGLPKRSDFEIVEEELPPLNDGGQQTQHQCCMPLSAHIVLILQKFYLKLNG